MGRNDLAAGARARADAKPSGSRDYEVLHPRSEERARKISLQPRFKGKVSSSVLRTVLTQLNSSIDRKMNDKNIVLHLSVINLFVRWPKIVSTFGRAIC
jgi:hypothetical protein